MRSRSPFSNRLVLFMLVVTALTSIALSGLLRASGLPAEEAGGGDGERDSADTLTRLDLDCPRCNIILLNIELLRADYVGLINPSRTSSTPAIDRFFGTSAVVFNDASAAAGESYRGNLAVQTSMSSFQFPVSEKRIHQFIGDGSPRDPTGEHAEIVEMLTRFPTMAQYFDANEFYTISMNQGLRAGRHLLLDRGFQEVIDWSRQRESYVQTIDDLISVLRRGLNQPFFIHYRPEVLHPFPYYYPDSRPRIEVPGEIFNHYRPRFNRYNIRFRPSLPPARKREIHHRIYRQQVRYVDDELGRLFSVIRDLELDDSSIIVLYANHGTGLGDNGIHKLAVSYQSCIHVPLIIHHPGIRENLRIEAPVPLIDLAPTLLEMTGLYIPKHFQGQSLLREYSDAPARYLAGRNDYDEYIRRGEFKLVVKNGEFLELYDIAADPSETVNLAQDRPELVRQLYRALQVRKLAALRASETAPVSLH